MTRCRHFSGAVSPDFLLQGTLLKGPKNSFLSLSYKVLPSRRNRVLKGLIMQVTINWHAAKHETMAQLCPICNPKSGSRANPLPKHLQLTYFLLRVQETIYSKNIHRLSRDLYQHAIKVCLGIKVNFALLISSKFPSIWRQMAHYQHGHWPVRWDSNNPKFLWYANLIFSHVSVSKIYFNLSNLERKRSKPLECRPK